MTDKVKHAGNVDWVAELFPPRFAININDEGITDDSRAVDKSEMRQTISVYDPDSVDDVCEKIRLLVAFGKELKMEEAERLRTPETPFHHHDDPVPPRHTTKGGSSNNSCLWNSEELSTLRDVYKSVKSENQALQVHLTETSRVNKALRTKVTDLEQKCSCTGVGLTEALKANARLTIQCANLQKENKQAHNKIDALQQNLNEVKNDKLGFTKQLQEIKLALNKERLKRRILEIDIDRQNQDFEQEKLMAVDSVKVDCDKQYNTLVKEMKQLSTDLENERSVHSMTQKALHHLRTHFASLPTPNISTHKPNAGIVKHDVTTVSYS